MSKLEEKELKDLQENQNNLSNVFVKLGQVSRALDILPNQKSELNSEVDKLEKEQQNLMKETEEKYGKISIDLQSGEYEMIPEKK